MSADTTVRSEPTASVSTSRTVRVPAWIATNGWRLAIIAVALSAWQYVPQIPGLKDSVAIFNPFYISSPSRVFSMMWDLATASNGQESIWPYLWNTVGATFIGVGIGVVGGGLVGLLLSNAPRLCTILNPFITILNATPRIALVPIFIIIAGPTLMSSVLVCVAVVFFLAFYNALAGGRSVPHPAVENAKLLGATNLEVLHRVRLPYVLVWTFASLPNGISFGLISVVTAELLTGSGGMGRLLSIAMQTIDSSLTFAVVIFLTMVGVIVITGTEFIEKRVLHWWDK